jgi:hypothetical protein
MKIEVMEFGVNILMPSQPAQLLQRALLHGTHELNRNTYGGRGHLVEAVRTQYYLKLYDKGWQLVSTGQLLHYPGHVLRVEAKTRAMEWVKSAGVATLADLCNPAALERLGSILQRAFAEMLFACPMPLPEGLPKTTAALLTRGATVPYWKGLTPYSHTATKTKFRKAQALVPDELLHAATVGLPATWLQLLKQPEPGAAAAAVEPALPLASVRPSEALNKDSDARTAYVPHTLPLSVSSPAAAGEGGKARTLPTMLPANDDERRGKGSMQARTPAADGGLPAREQRARNPVASSHPTGQRRCATCGLPINTGNPLAKFCSPVERGKQHARRCRNADSNPRLAVRRTLQTREARVGGTLPIPFAA